jgi:hypothetical protein
MKGIHMVGAADPMLVTQVITPVQRTSSATRCDRMGVCQNLTPRCAGCDLVRGCKPTPKPAWPFPQAPVPSGYLSKAELPYLKREHTLCAAD